jgi:hypothetical protein
MPSFPTREQNELLRRLARDPRFVRQQQERPQAPKTPPTKYRRVGRRQQRWELPRALPPYEVVQDESIGGKATKWVIRGPGGDDDFYIAKFGNKNGRTEVFTELFNNQLGEALGFDMAHSGVARLDNQLYFISQNFRRSERLIHGSLLIEDAFEAKDELERIETDREQQFYSIDFIEAVIAHTCGQSTPSVFCSLLEMLVFDCLIGSMDRHATNWGVLRSNFVGEDGNPAGFRLAPIFDSARALLWDRPEGKLLLLDNDPQELVGYLARSRPCMGPAPDHNNVNVCNHFDFFKSLLERYPHQVEGASRKILPIDVRRIAGKLLNQFPFSRAFSSLRKRVVLKVLSARADILKRVGQGEASVQAIQAAVQDPTAHD